MGTYHIKSNRVSYFEGLMRVKNYCKNFARSFGEVCKKLAGGL